MARVSSRPSERKLSPLLARRAGEGPAPRRGPQNAVPPTRYVRSMPQQEPHRPHCAHIGLGREAGARQGATAVGGGQARDKRAVSTRAAERACEATTTGSCNLRVAGGVSNNSSGLPDTALPAVRFLRHLRGWVDNHHYGRTPIFFVCGFVCG